MVKRKPFPPEPKTRPDGLRAKVISGTESRPPERRSRDQVSTLPPPPDPADSSPPTQRAVSKERPVAPTLTSATVDEVTADLTRDWRSERED
jgi:twitching motility protein PilT